MIVGTFFKGADRTVDYAIDWSKYLDSDDTISTSVLTADSAITIVSNGHTTTTVTMVLSGGAAGAVYEIANQITTAAALIFDASILIRVSSLTVGTDTYVSMEDADRYLALRDATDWLDKGEAERESALRRATSYLDGRYRGKWKGSKTDAAQPLAWPRTDATDEDGNDIDEDTIPDVIVSATCEAARREAVTPGSLNPDFKRGGLIRKVQAGPVSVEWAPGAPAETTIKIIDDILSGLLAAGGASNVSFLLRA